MTVVSPTRATGPLVLAIDVGTSSVRADLYDAHGRRLRDLGAQLPCPVETSPDGGATVDPEELFRLTTEVLDRVVCQAEGTTALPPIRAVATATFWHSVLGVDDAGLPTTPLLLWADSRARVAMPALRQRLDQRAVHGRTGCVLHWSYLPAKLLWLAEAQRDAFRRTARWVSFGEYFQLKIFGRAVCSLSMASGTGLLDQNRRDWDDEVLEALPIDRQQLSPLGDVDAPLADLAGDFAARWPLLRAISWLPALGDGACSNVGSGCVTRERMALMVGTSGALRVAWRADQTGIPDGAWCYRVDGRRFVMGGALTNGGNLFAWMQRTLKLGSSAAVERELAQMEPDEHGLTVLPFLAGERAPGYAADARAAVLGLTLATTPLQILRAGLEAVALRFALLYDILSSEVPEARTVVATGGALGRSPAWVQIVADALGQPVVLSGEPEASGRGAAMLALEWLGAVESVESAPAALGRTYEPDPARHAVYRAAQERHRVYYRELVARNQGEGGDLARRTS
jgi:gluconokinase